MADGYAQPHAEYLRQMVPLACDEQVHYFQFCSKSPPPLDITEQVIRGAWQRDYAKRGDAVFDYDIYYLEWLFQPNTFDGIWATTVDGQPIGLIVLTRRTVQTPESAMSAHYGSMLSVSRDFRGHGIGQRMYELFFYKVVRRRGVLLGVMDGESGGKRVSYGFVDSEKLKKHNLENPLWTTISKQYTIWAACKDIALLNAYMPLPPGLSAVALSSVVRRLIEFKFDKPSQPGYHVGLVVPGTYRMQPHMGGTWFPTSDIAALYGRGYERTAGTYRVSFGADAHCEVSYTVHKVIKDGLPDTTAGHLQLIRCYKVSPAQTRQSIKVVTNKLMEGGAVAVLVHHTNMVGTKDLLQAGFLPSGRTIRYMLGWHASAAAPQSFNDPVFFDLL